MKEIYLKGEVIYDETLNNLKDQAGDENSFNELRLVITSPGGDVAEGIEIMRWLDQMQQDGKVVYTRVNGNAYSIASVIPLIAPLENRDAIGNHSEYMVHNPMVPVMEYANAEELEQEAQQLRLLEDLLINLYNIFTGIEKEEIRKLMNEETFFSAEDALTMGFVSSIVEGKKIPYSMKIKINKQRMNLRINNAMRKVLATVEGKNTVMQKYYVKTGGDIEIYQKDMSTYKIGDKVSIESGVVNLNDGSTLEISDSEIKNITKEAVNTVVNGEFNTGPEPKKEMKVEPEMTVETKEQMYVEPEMKVEPEMTAEPEMKEIVDVIENPTNEIVEEKTTVVPNEEVIAVEEAPVTSDIEAQVMLIAEGLVECKNRIMSLEEKVMGVQAGYQKEMKAVVKDMEEVADAVALVSNFTAGNFKPKKETLKKVLDTSGMSPFQRAKAKLAANKEASKK